MKKLSLIFISFMLVGAWAFAQQAEYVVKQEFQEKTKSLGAQVSSVKKLSADLNSNLTAVKGSVDGLEAKVNELQTAYADSITICQGNTKELRKSFVRYRQKSKMLLIVELLLIIGALGFAFTIKRGLGKKLATAQKQVDETNNMLIEQGKSLERKIGLLSDSIAELKAKKAK